MLVLKEIEEDYSLVIPEEDEEVKLNRVGWGGFLDVKECGERWGVGGKCLFLLRLA